MAIIENNYTGDGSTVLYPFTFEYIDAQDVKVQLDGTDTTEYSLDNATTVRMNTAPAQGVGIRVYRETSTDSMPATFFSGSTIQANDLNDNFNVALYVSQEAQASAGDAAASLPVATAALTAATAAVSTANDAAADAATANTTAGLANSTANTALTTANTAIGTANSASVTADAAAALVAQANLPVVVPNFSSVPASPSNNDLIEVQNSNGIQNFTPLAGLPAGFTGDNIKAVKLLYTDVGTTWNYLEYRITDPEIRYAQIDDVATDISTVTAAAAAAQTTANTANTTANAALPKSGGTMTGVITFDASQDFGIETATGIREGVVTLNSDVNLVSGNAGGLAATPLAVKTAYDQATVAENTATNAQSTANAAQTAATNANNNANGRLSLSGGTLSGALSVPSIEVGGGGNASSTTIRFGAAGTGLYYVPTSGAGGSIRFASGGVGQFTIGGDALTWSSGTGNIESKGNGDVSNRGFFLSGRERAADVPNEFRANNGSSTNRNTIFRGNASGTTFIIYNDGSADTRGSNVSSDLKLKQNITDARSQWDDVKALRFRNFEYKDEPGREMFGWIAQEVQEVSPGAVVDRGTHLSVKADLLTWKGMKALQEAMARIERLEARIAELEG